MKNLKSLLAATAIGGLVVLPQISSAADLAPSFGADNEAYNNGYYPGYNEPRSDYPREDYYTHDEYRPEDYTLMTSTGLRNYARDGYPPEDCYARDGYPRNDCYARDEYARDNYYARRDYPPEDSYAGGGYPATVPIHTIRRPRTILRTTKSPC